MSAEELKVCTMYLKIYYGEYMRKETLAEATEFSEKIQALLDTILERLGDDQAAIRADLAKFVDIFRATSNAPNLEGVRRILAQSLTLLGLYKISKRVAALTCLNAIRRSVELKVVEGAETPEGWFEKGRKVVQEAVLGAVKERGFQGWQTFVEASSQKLDEIKANAAGPNDVPAHCDI